MTVPVWRLLLIRKEVGMRILVAFESSLYRDGLVSLIQTKGPFKRIDLASTLPEAIDAAKRLRPDVVVMSEKLLDRNGLEEVQALKAESPEVHFFILVENPTPKIFLEALRSGVRGYMQSNISSAELIESLVKVARGEVLICSSMLQYLLDDYLTYTTASVQPVWSNQGNLTTRELDVLYQLTLGASNQEIAARLYVTENTVKNHVHSILSKLKLNNRREAVSFAQQARFNFSTSKNATASIYSYEA
jgi:two-component system NarL family response regulator